MGCGRILEEGKEDLGNNVARIEHFGGKGGRSVWRGDNGGIANAAESGVVAQ